LVINCKYSYKEEDVFKKWLAFGICLEIKDKDEAEEIHGYLTKEGFRCNSMPRLLEGQQAKITILLNDKLREVLKAHNIEVADTKFENGNLYNLITQCKDWMINGYGEGLVCVSDEFQKKWKIGMEHQPSIFNQLECAIKKISTFDDIDTRIIEAANVFLQVKDSNKLMGQDCAKSKSKPKEKKEKKQIFDSGDVKAAIDSALTKYDSMDVFFQENKMKELCELIIEEVNSDLLPATPEDVPEEDALKEINNSVRRFVGIKFGQWKNVKQE